MKKFLFIASLTMLFLAVGAFAQKGKPKPTPGPTPTPTPAPSPTPGLYVKFRFLECGETYRGVTPDCDPEGNGVTRVNQDIQGDWYENGNLGVSAIISGASGDLIVTLDGSQRSLKLDFSDQRYEGSPTASFVDTSPLQNVKPRFNFLRAYTAKQMCDQTDAATTECEYQGRLNMGYWYAQGTPTSGPSAVSYKLAWNHEPLFDADRPANYPCTTAWISVRYVKPTATEPALFIFTALRRAADEVSSPDPSVTCAAGETLGGLETVTKRSTSAAGQFHMPFTAVAEIIP